MLIFKSRQKNKNIEKKLKKAPNGVIIKSKNRRTEIVDMQKNGVRVSIISLTKDTGKGIGAISQMFKDDKIKFSEIRFSEDGLKDLYIALHHYFNKEN